MSRKLTNWNPNHPHMQMKRYLETAKKFYRQQSNEVVAQMVRGALKLEANAGIKCAVVNGEEVALLHRHQRLEFLLACAQSKFFFDFAEQNGFPFEDVYDKEKMAAHRRAYQEKQKAKANEIKAEEKWEPVGIGSKPELQ
jgi:hypothetical protein